MIIDDGYHASKHQQITLVSLWETLKPGGIYVIEDLHYQPLKETELKTRDMLREWKIGNYISSNYIAQEEATFLGSQIDKIELYPSESLRWPAEVTNCAIAFIYKI